MKKLKLYPKTFLYTLSFMLLIILLSHLLIYFLLPGVYNLRQKSGLQQDAAGLMQEISEAEEEERLSRVIAFAIKWNANIAVSYNGYSYEADLLNSPSDALLHPQAGVTDAIIRTEGGSGSMKISLEENTQGGADFFRISEVFPDGKGSLSAVVSRQQIEDAVDVIVLILPFTALLCTLFAAGFALLYSRTLTKPIAEISDATGRMKALRPDSFCKSGAQDEIGILADNVNSLYQTLLFTIRDLECEIHKVETAEKQKTDFLRAASHELKTPVTAVSAMLENMLLNIGKYKDRDTYLARCKVLTDRLASMIKEILDASGADSYSLQEASELDLAGTVVSVSEPYRIIAKSNGISFHMELPDSFPIRFPARGLERVLSNLLSNAVAYTPSGGSIWISLNVREFVIENECSLISDDQLSRVFEAFYRPDYGRDRAAGGNGLGLYIVASVLGAADVSFEFAPSERINGMAFRIQF